MVWPGVVATHMSISGRSILFELTSFVSVDRIHLVVSTSLRQLKNILSRGIDFVNRLQIERKKTFPRTAQHFLYVLLKLSQFSVLSFVCMS